jgi:hypothetical protein
MATRERVETDVVCDRCGRRVSRNRQCTELTSDGPKERPRAAAVVDTDLDLCLPCDRSLTAWWARKSIEKEAAE